ncbi:Protein C46C11.1 a [Aphelenchoides avenae]|nr:Protein C46C11.1 a [Aphelenchus avenae]
MTGTTAADTVKSYATPLARKAPLGPRLSVQREAVLTLLKQLAIENAGYFATNSTSTYAKRIRECCEEVSTLSDTARGLIKDLQEASHRCDYDANTPGNGFRSLVCVCDTVILQLISLLRIFSENRNTMMFRVGHYCKEIESFGAVFRFLVLSGLRVIALMPLLDRNSLFPNLKGDYSQFSTLFKEIEVLDASCFYGRSMAFQFPPSVARIFRIIGLILAAYSLTWENRSSAFGSLLHSGRFLLNPEQRALHIIKVTREADLEFCRGFWNLSELAVPQWYCPSMAINEVREVPMAGPLPLETTTGSTTMIPEPCAHTGPRPVPVRILSLNHREGLSTSSGRLPLSPYILIHCHGGGYVATSSKSHETYLRSWAKSLNCTVVSIDYSLSPENPFPRPTEEVVYVYAWIINNPEKFGWTGEKLCMVGDSAGGNLIVSANLRLVELNVKRQPDGIVPIYTPFLFQYLPSPSRVLSFMDPLLHMGVVIRCAAAYTGACSDEPPPTSEPEANGVTPSTNGHKSLQEYVDEVKAQRESYFDFNKGSQSIVSLVNIYPGRSEQSTSSANVSSANEHVRQSCLKRVRSDNPAASEDVLDEESSIVDDPDQTPQSVHVDADPHVIRLSSVNYDETLISYLQTHPLTKSHVINPENEDGEDEAMFEASESFKQIPKSSTTGLISSLLGVNGNSETAESMSSSASSDDVRATQPIVKTKLTRKNPRSFSQSLADTAALAAGHAYDNLAGWFEPSSESYYTRIDKPKLSRSSPLRRMLDDTKSCNAPHVVDLIDLKLPREPLISPMYADPEMLRKLPPVRFVACHLDPLLDDTIAFARKLRDAGGNVESIDLLDSLPHGFLNFAPMSPDCRNGSAVCLSRIKQILGIVSTP